MSQTSDNSRTFRIINLADDVKTKLSELKATVTQHENINYVEVSTVPEIAAVKAVLDGANMKYKQCSYSTFVRFKNQMTVDDLNALATSLCQGHEVNVLYSRVDENNHTGKLVVDRLDDYNTLKANTGDVSFYRFSPISVPQPRTGGAPRTGGGNSGDWETVPTRRQTVQGRYAQAVTGAATQAPVQAPRVTASRGRGASGAGRGRGRPAKSAPAPSSA
jgi:hypothetical protein